jgi:hypothetical protein
MAAVCPEEDGTTIITTQDMLKLAENAKVISALEDIYSLTCVPHPRLPVL